MARPRKTPAKEYPLMPRATAVWLVENTALTFTQISEFCGLHPLEVQGIADGEVAIGVRGADPIANHQLTRDEITAGEEDHEHELQLAERRVSAPSRKTVGPRYTPISKRQDKPDAIVWLLRNHPDLKDAQIARLIGTTKNTIQAIRDRRHWNSANLRPRDPVLMELCTSEDLSHEADRAKRARERAEKRAAKEAKQKGTTMASESPVGALGASMGSVGDIGGASVDGALGASVSPVEASVGSVLEGGISGESASGLGADFQAPIAETQQAETQQQENTPPTTQTEKTQMAETQDKPASDSATNQAGESESAASEPTSDASEDDSPFAALRGFKVDS